MWRRLRRGMVRVSISRRLFLLQNLTRYHRGQHKCTMDEKMKLSIQCRANGCESSLTTRGRFNRHWNTKHRNGGIYARQKISCPFIGCARTGDNGFARQDNLRQHRRNVHSENIPKERRRCTGIVTIR